MQQNASSRTPVLAAALFLLVASILIAPVGLLIVNATADTQAMSVTAEVPDTVSDQVAATAAEFRVDESGAATYSIPLYTVPGTAGVAPKLSLNYSSQSGVGPLGKGWSIGGLSSIARCRATREAGDFISGGQPFDGTPAPINFTASDRYCLDGQRLVPGPTGCPAMGGMAVSDLRTEIESFQRVCAYTPLGGLDGIAFFTVERKDGSISWYGDRDNYGPANRVDAYVNSTTPGKTTMAMAWAQTRFQDSTGNYMDYLYWNIQPIGDVREHLLKEVRFTGKTVLPGQSGPARLPYARIIFNYVAKPTSDWVYVYQSGGRMVQSRQVDSISSVGYEQFARFYELTYGTSVSGSKVDTLTSFQECRDYNKTVCLPATTFAWSQAKHELATSQSWNPGYFGSTQKFEGFKFGDVDGDGRPDLVWLKDGSSGETCATEHVMVSFGEIDTFGRQSFSAPVFAGCTPTELQSSLGAGSWQLFDYTGDGREDLFVAGGGKWFLYASMGRSAQPFNTGVDLLASIYIPMAYSPTAGYHPQLTDLNGDGLFDVVYLNNGMRVRFMERSGADFVWGAERQATYAVEPPEPCPPEAIDGVCNMSGPALWDPETFRLNDFNGDAASDLLFTVTQSWRELCEGDLEMCPKPVLHVSAPRRYWYAVSSITATTVEFKRQSRVLSDMWWNSKPLVGDINGDGLTDLVYRRSSDQAFVYVLNNGVSFTPSTLIGALPRPELAKLLDVNGDGRTDLAYVNTETDGTYRYFVRYALPTGEFGPPDRIAGNWALPCIGAACDPNSFAHMFSDLDGDGGLDYFAIKIDTNPVFYLSQAGATSRAQPRDVITSITNGLGAKTELTYAPLTNSAVYRRDYNSRNSLNWGRSSPVMDFLAPTYVVAKASSSSPQLGSPNAMASLYYRYAGAKVQAGGRGFLGFREIVTYDPNQTGGYVATSTEYAQHFPYIGMPTRTIKSAFNGSAYVMDSCLTLMPNNACYGLPGAGHPAVGGSWFADSAQVWEVAPAFAPGSQVPWHVRTSGTEEKLRDPIGGAQTSRIVTTFSYGSHGNVTATTADTYEGASGTAMATVITANTYTDDPTRWRLGRLTNSVVTHRRPGRADVVRESSFGYSMAGAATGLLTFERTQPSGSADQSLRKEYALDEFGNRTIVKTCSDPATACSPTIDFHPATPTAIQRYQRVAYDSLGRYPLATYELFWNGAGATERATQTVVSRDIFGNVTEATDANGASAVAVAGTFGRPYYTWTQTVPEATAGDPAAGVESKVVYAWCATITCPTGAKFRQSTITDDAPMVWAYFDALGRPIFKITETFNMGVSGKAYVAVCTDYDAAGRVKRVSNPFFILPGDYTNSCTTGPVWTTTTYDVLGRPTLTTAPDSTTVQAQYAGLQTTTIDPRGNATVQLRNGKGELSTVTDAAGLATTYSYYADGSMNAVTRDAGRGAITNSFVNDVLGRKIQQSDPDAGVSTLQYNALGELIAQVDADGNRIENEIDGRGRVWRKTVKLPGGSIESQSTYVYDTLKPGQPTSETISGTYATGSPSGGDALSFQRTYSYDSLGRSIGSVTTIDGASYTTAVQYNVFGRAWKGQDASGRWAKTEFNGRGMAKAVCNSSAADAVATCPSSTDTYVATLETDAWGHVIKERRGNNAAMDVVRDYNATTGRLANICAGNAVSCNLVDEGYGWDAAGNLSTQLKEDRYLETFTYDNLNRLREAKLSMEDGINVNKVTQSFVYDKLGNICSKTVATQTQDYTYLGRAGCGTSGLPGSGGAGSVGPHQVSAVLPSVPAFYYYDGRGNQTQQDSSTPSVDRTVTYSADDKAYDILMGSGQRERFWYGSDGQRYKRVGDGKTTIYLGNVEIVTDGGVTTTKRTVAGVMLQTVIGSTASNQYLFHDHLGSLARITSETGSVINSQDYNAFGTRRDYADPMGVGTAPALTTRGFTGHEHVDGTGVIHMNGRIFAPGLGRFLQPDPMVQSPDNSQSWNAYTYGFNNPLMYTDPTGLWGQKEQGILRTVAAIVITVYTGGAAAGAWGFFGTSVAAGSSAAYGVAMLGGFAAGAVQSGTMKGALQGAFSATLFYGVGQYATQLGVNDAVRAGMHALAGGVIDSLQGGNFGNGFVSAGLSKLIMPSIDTGNAYADAALAAIAGGAISEATGGKFANGAMTAAIQLAFNQLAQRTAAAQAAQRRALILVGDQGLGEHNVGTAFADAANTAAERIRGAGGRADIVRVSSIDDVNNALSDGDPIGAVYFYGHATNVSLHPGEGAGSRTNIDFGNVRELTAGNMVPGSAMYIFACNAGYPGTTNIADQIALSLNRPTYGYSSGMHFTNNSGFTISPPYQNWNNNGAVYMRPDNGQRATRYEAWSSR